MNEKITKEQIEKVFKILGDELGEKGKTIMDELSKQITEKKIKEKLNNEDDLMKFCKEIIQGAKGDKPDIDIKEKAGTLFKDFFSKIK